MTPYHQEAVELLLYNGSRKAYIDNQIINLNILVLSCVILMANGHVQQVKPEIFDSLSHFTR